MIVLDIFNALDSHTENHEVKKKFLGKNNDVIDTILRKNSRYIKFSLSTSDNLPKDILFSDIDFHIYNDTNKLTLSFIDTLESSKELRESYSFDKDVIKDESLFILTHGRDLIDSNLEKRYPFLFKNKDEIIDHIIKFKDYVEYFKNRI